MSRLALFASFLVSIVFAAGCATGPPKGIEPVQNFELDHYLGQWYEIARLDHRFERGLTHVSAEYSLRDDGNVRVLNRGYNAKDKEWSDAEGIAKFRGPKDVGSLKVSFFGPFYGGYHIVELDPEYRWALVSGPDKSYLWILSRTPTMDAEVLSGLIARAKSEGYPTDELIMVEQGNREALVGE